MNPILTYFKLCDSSTPNAQRYLGNWYVWAYDGAMEDFLRDQTSVDGGSHYE